MISPVLGGAIAALLLAFVEWRIVRRGRTSSARARAWVPVLVGLMGGVFAAYMALKGLNRIVHLGLGAALSLGAVAGVVAYGLGVLVVRRQARGLENRRRSLKVLFALPLLIVSAGLLSFAHGANDVANAVGPLAAIVQVALGGDVADTVAIPAWVMVIGAAGISLGLFLFGPKTDPHGRRPDHQAEPGPGVLRGALGCPDGDRRLVVRAAGEFDPHRGRRRIRGRLLSRVGRSAQDPKRGCAQDEEGPRRGGAAAGASWCGAPTS